LGFGWIWIGFMPIVYVFRFFFFFFSSLVSDSQFFQMSIVALEEQKNSLVTQVDELRRKLEACEKTAHDTTQQAPRSVLADTLNRDGHKDVCPRKEDWHFVLIVLSFGEVFFLLFLLF
jgi:hypothetical protein